jgi:hypothetical protein
MSKSACTLKRVRKKFFFKMSLVELEFLLLIRPCYFDVSCVSIILRKNGHGNLVIYYSTQECSLQPSSAVHIFWSNITTAITLPYNLEQDSVTFCCFLRESCRFLKGKDIK